MRGSKRPCLFDQPFLLKICKLPLSWLVALAWCQVLRTIDISGTELYLIAGLQSNHSWMQVVHPAPLKQDTTLAAFGVERASSTGEWGHGSY
ncbi:hypothetical protein BC835DRAFT_1356601 [Cytidiella melzeri]|nr:hypothetical protein BC835DRAFT_1356601 [Cytidiella melzeri]